MRLLVITFSPHLLECTPDGSDLTVLSGKELNQTRHRLLFASAAPLLCQLSVSMETHSVLRRVLEPLRLPVNKPTRAE